MGNTDERRLRQRLARVEALERGATTEGERRAAAAASERLRARIEKVRGADPVARFVAAHVRSMGRGARPPEPPVSIPRTEEILRVLARWESGDWSRHDVEAWAEQIVDRVVMPSEPAHPDFAAGEVLLQLAMLHRVALSVTDVPGIRTFLADGDLVAWFELIEVAARRGWPVG